MAFLSGTNGTLAIGGATVLHVRRWRIQKQAANKAYTANDTGGAKKRVSGVRDCTGSLEILATDSQNIPVAEGDLVALALHVDRSGANYYQLEAVVDAIRTEADISQGNPVVYVIEFSANGPVTEHGILQRST